jgi:glycine cleavage system regulatory protein
VSTSLVLTVIGPDRPGIVNSLSDRITQHGGNWLQSRMANLAGQFAGIVLLQLPEARVDALVGALRELEGQGLRIVVARAGAADGAVVQRRLLLEMVGHDRPGIVQQISRELALRGVSIEELATDCVSGSMSGESLMRARAQLRAPATLSVATLRHALEALANDLMVDVTLDESASRS